MPHRAESCERGRGRGRRRAGPADETARHAPLAPAQRAPTPVRTRVPLVFPDSHFPLPWPNLCSLPFLILDEYFGPVGNLAGTTVLQVTVPTWACQRPEDDPFS